MDVLPKVDTVGLKILFLLMPGIIAFFVIKSVGPKRPRTDFESGLQIFLYGIVCYAVAGLVQGIYVWHAAAEPRPPFWNEIGRHALGLATLNAETGLGAGQIAFTAVVALVIGLTVAVIQTHSIPHRLLGK